MVRRATISFQSSHFPLRTLPAKRALTLVELLIVIVIIGVLLSSILVAASHLIGRSKEQNTQGVLQIVSDAVEEFKREQIARATITKNSAYKKRYGLYPPDELEVFTAEGVPVPAGTTKTGSLATPSGSVILPKPPYSPMRFYADRSDLVADANEHRDLAALIVAIETHGDASAAILAKLPDRNLSAGALGADGNPSQFLDRPQGINGAPSGGWDADDLQIRYILDDWGMPISYLAQRDWEEDKEDERRSKNHRGWNKGSTEIVRLNGGVPVVFSYGANGKDQLTSEMMGNSGAASLIGDFEPEAPSASDQEDVIDHPANADNVYANPALKEKLAKGIE